MSPHPLTNFEIQKYYQNEIVYFDSFGVEHIPEEIEEFSGNKNIKCKHFSSTGKRFNNVWVLLHWIH